MSETQKYVPLSERVQQDVWHDNFVPKYSALASAEPSRLVLVGVWLIFAPMAFGSIFFAIGSLSEMPDGVTAIVFFVSQALVGILATTILFTQTRRHWRGRLNRADDEDEGDEGELGSTPWEATPRR